MAGESCAVFIMDCRNIICENLGVWGPSDLLPGWCGAVGILDNPRPAPMPDCHWISSIDNIFQILFILTGQFYLVLTKDS